MITNGPLLESLRKFPYEVVEVFFFKEIIENNYDTLSDIRNGLIAMLFPNHGEITPKIDNCNLSFTRFSLFLLFWGLRTDKTHEILLGR